MTDPASITAKVKGNNLPFALRVTLLVFASIGLLFCIGFVLGLISATVEQGAIKPRGAAVLGAALAGIGLLGWACWSLSAYWRHPERSAYERRYSRMMLFLFATGLPVGLLLGMAGDGLPHDSLFSNGPLDPRLAGAAALALVLLLASALVTYHRAIDDHEQQAYLWANSLSFYFLAIALPVAWLLARGGLIAPIGIGSAMLILLAAFVINFAVWAWLKYR
jgi:hypothetical protein